MRRLLRALAVMQRTVAIACLVFFFAPALAASASSAVKANLVGNGIAVTVTLLQKHHSVAVIAHSARPHVASQTLTFGVNPSRQDAVCSLPVSIKVVPLSCSAEAGPLP